MSRRVLIAFLCFSGTANAQLNDSNSLKELPQSLAGHSGPADADGRQYSFEIRMVSVSEDAVRALRQQAIPGLEQPQEHIPFEGWQILDPDQKLVLQKAETRINPSTDAAVSEMTDRQFRQFIAEAQQGERNNIVFAPKVTVFEGQVGTITDQSNIQYVDSGSRTSGNVTLSKAVEGTQIFVRATVLDSGCTQADVEIHLHGLPDRRQISVSEDGVLTRAPQQTVSTLACSGLMSGEVLHIALLPHESPAESVKAASRIELASRVVGLGKPQTPESRRIVCFVSVRRVAD